MPDAAEIFRFVLELDHRNDLRKAFDAFDEGVFDHLAEALGEGEEFGRRQILVAEKDDVVLEPDLADFADDIVAGIGREIDAQNFRADRARQAPHFETVRLP